MARNKLYVIYVSGMSYNSSKNSEILKKKTADKLTAGF